MFYRLPHFIAEVLDVQPKPPRRVPFGSVVRAVLGGADCAIYLASGVLFIWLGLYFDARSQLVTGKADWGGFMFIGAGVLFVLLAVFRIWQVERVLKRGEAEVARVVTARSGWARVLGSPWGEPIGRKGYPMAARGTYRVIGSEKPGEYDMQQSWAVNLKPGAQIWVLRLDSRDVLYAPVLPIAS
jgi:hypothetical protein